MESGMVQIYCGDGKGKTSAAVGLAARAAGAGLSVLFALFLKTGDDVFVADELLDAINLGLVDLAGTVAWLRGRPAGLEVVLTGRDPAPELVELADYVSEVKRLSTPSIGESPPDAVSSTEGAVTPGAACALKTSDVQGLRHPAC